MNDDLASYPALALRGEKVSIASPSMTAHYPSWHAVDPALETVRTKIATIGTEIARGADPITRPTLFFCLALLLWGAPALVLLRYSPNQLLHVLFGIWLNATTDDLLILLAAVAFFVGTGLLVGSATQRLARGLGRYRIALRVAIAPAILLSLLLTGFAGFLFFLGVLLRCCPSLL